MPDNSLILADTRRLSANSVHAGAQPAGKLRPRVEQFCQLFAASGDAAASYRKAFRCRPGSKPATQRRRAYDLVHRPDVAARVRQLLAESAGDAVVATKARMARLQAIVEADPSELVRIVRVPCPSCWPAAEAQANTEQGGEAAPLLGAQAAPREGCSACRGDGARQVVVTPTDDLSPAARMLLKGVRQKGTGEIEVRMHDQLAASDQLNKLQGSYAPERSVGLTAHVNVDFSAMTREQQLDFLESLRPTT